MTGCEPRAKWRERSGAAGPGPALDGGKLAASRSARTDPPVIGRPLKRKALNAHWPGISASNTAGKSAGTDAAVPPAPRGRVGPGAMPRPAGEPELNAFYQPAKTEVSRDRCVSGRATRPPILGWHAIPYGIPWRLR